MAAGVDSLQVGLQAWIRVRVSMLGPLLGLDPLGPYEWRVGPKSKVPTMPPFFRLGSSIFPGWKNAIFFTWLSGTGDH